jgi:hypothetical protein
MALLAGMGRVRAPKAVGTYGFLDVLCHPSRVFRPPSASESASDIEAVHAGGPEASAVSCEEQLIRSLVD